MTTRIDDSPSRQDAMALFSRATPEVLAAAVERLALTRTVVDLKAPETGLVMVRGRIGGDGAPFNVGEATVTRSVVRLACGTVGYSYRLGRDKAAARNAAILDALWQLPAHRERIETHVLKTVRHRIAAERDRASREAASSRVEFFTLSREGA